LTKKPTIQNGDFVNERGVYLSIINDIGYDCYASDIYALNLKPLEIAEVIIDTDTQKYEVVRPREVGWYLTVWLTDDKRAIARYWNGDAFHSNRNCGKCIPIPESEITVIYELPECDFLRSLE